MQAIPLTAHSYKLASRPLAAQQLVNMFAEAAPKSATRAVGGFYLRSCPGSEGWVEVGTGPIRGVWPHQGALVAVSGKEVYNITTAGAATKLGEIVYAETPVLAVSNGAQLMLIANNSGWYVSSAALNIITDVDLTGVTSAAFMNGRIFVIRPSSQVFQWSASYDVTSWDALDFASAELSPDRVRALIANQQTLWMLGEDSVEAWYWSGGRDLPLERYVGMYLERGTLAPRSVLEVDQTFMFLGDDGRVYQKGGQQTARISTTAIEQAIQGYTKTSDAFAFTYVWDGHHFYNLTFPTAGRTWVFDTSTRDWHERQTGVGTLASRWRYNCSAVFAEKVLVGDNQSGRIDMLTDAATEAGLPTQRIFTMPELHSARERFNVSRLELDIESGVGAASGQGYRPRIMFDFSRDGGRTWNDERTMAIGKQGQYGARPYLTRAGGRCFNFLGRCAVTDPVPLNVYGAYIGNG